MKKRWMGLLACLAMGQVQAASFDCEKVGTKVEKLICANADLSKLDEDLASAYGSALAQADKPDTLKQAQKTWLKLRNTCADPTCVKRAYESRIEIMQCTSKNQPGKESIKHCGDHKPITHPTYIFKLADLAIHGSYTNKTRNTWEVCRDFLKNLQTTPATTEQYACEVPLNPAMTQFSMPAWKDLNIADHWDKIYSIEAYTNPLFKSSATVESWRMEYENNIHAGKIVPRLRQAKLRLAANAPEETVFAYTKRGNNLETCKKNVATGKLPLGGGDIFFLFDPDSDPSSTYPASIGTAEPNSEVSFDARHEYRYFTHKSIVYFINITRPGVMGFDVNVFQNKYYPESTKARSIYYYSAELACVIAARPIPATHP